MKRHGGLWSARHPRHLRRRTTISVTPRHLRLIGLCAMLGAIRKACLNRLSAKMKIWLTRVTDRPLAYALIKIEQCHLRCLCRAPHRLGYRLGNSRHNLGWRGGRGRRPLGDSGRRCRRLGDRRWRCPSVIATLHRRWPRFKPEPVRFANNGVARHALAKLLGNLACRHAAFPARLQNSDAIFSPSHRKRNPSNPALAACIPQANPPTSTPCPICRQNAMAK